MVVRELINLIGWKVDQKQLTAAQKKTQKFMKSLKRVGMAVGIGILAIGAAAVKAAADMESLSAEFEVMLGSADKARILTKQIIDFAAATPFQVQGLSENTRTLLQFGIAVEDALPTLRMLGDVAGKNAGRLQSLTFAFGKIQSQGRLTGLELRQMITAGFNPLNAIVERTGESMEEVRKRMSKGGVSALEIADAFKTATSEGGMFFKNMEKQSKTFLGLVSTMKDNITLVLAEIGKKLLPFLKNLTEGITKLFQGSLGNILESLITVLTPIFEQAFVLIDSLLTMLVPIIQVLTDILKPIFDILAIIMPIVTDVVEILGEGLSDIIKDLANAFIPLLQVTAELLAELMPLLRPIIRIFTKILVFIIKLNMKVKLLFFGLFVKGLTLVLKLFQPLIRLLNKVLVPIFEWLEGIITKLTEFVTGIVDFLINGLIKGMEFLFKVINRIIEAINKIPFIDKKLRPLDSDEIIKNIKSEVIKTGDKVTNLQMQNQFTFNGTQMDKQGVKGGVQQAVGTPFQLQIKKIIADI